MYTTKKTAPEKNSPFNLHEQDQGAGQAKAKATHAAKGTERHGVLPSAVPDD